MAYKYFSTSKNSIKIYYGTSDSHAATHFEDTPGLMKLVKKIIPETEISGDSMSFETDTGRIVGTSDLVETTETDDIVYAIRKNRVTYARFTKSQKPKPNSKVTIILNKIESSDSYELHSAWIGPITPSFPGDEKETPESRPFWEKHALVWGNQEVDESTVTSICPW